MQRGGFVIENDGSEGGIPKVFWVTCDEATGSIVTRSGRLAEVENITGDRFSLIPTDQKAAHFRCEDTGLSCLHGRLVGYVTASPNDHFQTDEIVRVTTVDGEVVDTLLALTRPPNDGPVQTLTPEQIGIWMVDLLGRAVRGESEDDEGPFDGPQRRNPSTPSSKPPSADA